MMMTMMWKVIMMTMNITSHTKMYFKEVVKGKNETDSFNTTISTLAHLPTVNNKKMVKLTCLS